MRDGIRVNGVSPGPTATDRLVNLAGRKAQERFGDPARWPELYTSLPAGRVGQPAEVAAMVAFLASPKSSYTSGVAGRGEGGAHTGNLGRVSRPIKAGGSPARVGHFPVAVRVGSPLARFQVGAHWFLSPAHFRASRRPARAMRTRSRPSQLSPGPEPDRCRSRSAAQELALPTSVLAGFGRISSWSIIVERQINQSPVGERNRRSLSRRGG
jgi:hypothetical protein